MKSKPFIIKTDQNGYALVPIQPTEKFFSESWLQKLLYRYPQILPVDEIEPVFYPLIPIGREISTKVGMIDNLFISKAGYPVIVETKLWRNSQAKREVFAQVIDYAAEFSQWSFDQLDEVSRKYTNKGIIELIEGDDSMDYDTDELPTEKTISNNLRLGRFLILIVSDYVRGSLVNMLKFINKYPHLATNISIIELHCYKMPDSNDDIVVVPSIVAKTEIVERSIVQVNLVPNLEHHVSVEQKQKDPDTSIRHTLTEDAYWEALKQNSPASLSIARMVFDHFANFGEINLQMRQSAIVVRMNLPESDQRISLFFIRTNGLLECWITTIKGKLEQNGYDLAMVEEYEKELTSLFRTKTGQFTIQCPTNKLDVDAFINIVERFIDKIRKAEISPED